MGTNDMRYEMTSAEKRIADMMLDSAFFLEQAARWPESATKQNTLELARGRIERAKMIMRRQGMKLLPAALLKQRMEDRRVERMLLARERKARREAGLVDVAI